MKVTVKGSQGLERRLTVEVDSDTVTKKLDEVASELARKVNIPGGYRKFKAKVSRVKQMFRKQIGAEAAEALLKETVSDAVEQMELKTIGSPDLEEMSAPEPGKPFSYTLRVEIRPQLDNIRYKGLVVGTSSDEVTAEEVDERLVMLQRQATQLVETGSATIEEGHHLQLSVKPHTEDEALRERLSQTAMLELNDSAAEPLRQALLGKGLTDSGSVQACPSDLHLRAGDEHDDTALTWDYEVVKVMEKKVPALDDDFAAESRGLKSLLALRGELREEAKKEKASLTQRKSRHLLTAQLLEANRFDLPVKLIRAIYEDRIGRYREAMAQYGSIDEDLLKEIIASRRDEELDAAARETAEFLIIDAIALQEGIEVSEEQVEERLAELAVEREVQVEFLKARMSEEEKTDLKSKLRIDAVYRLIEANGVQCDLDEFVAGRVYERKKMRLVRRGYLGGKLARSSKLRKRRVA